MCVNKYLTGDATIMRRSHEVDRMKGGKKKKEAMKEDGVIFPAYNYSLF